MGHTYTRLLYHVIYSTHQRRRSLQGDVREALWSWCGGFLRNHGCVLLAMNGPADHVHLLVSAGPTVCLAELVRDLKRSSTNWLRSQGVDYGKFRWQEGYAAFSVSSSGQEEVRRYIADQAEHHREQTLEEELRRMLELHGVEYDPRFFLK